MSEVSTYISKIEDEAREARRERDELREENARLAKLIDYAFHFSTCQVYTAKKKCSCGLEGLMEEITAAKEVR